MYRGVVMYIIFKIGFLLLFRQMLKHTIKNREDELRRAGYIV